MADLSKNIYVIYDGNYFYNVLISFTNVYTVYESFFSKNTLFLTVLWCVIKKVNLQKFLSKNRKKFEKNEKLIPYSIFDVDSEYQNDLYENTAYSHRKMPSE